MPGDPAAPKTTARRGTPLFIVASPRPQVGKTFLARLLTDFLRLDGGEAVAFDLNPTGTRRETAAWRPAPTSPMSGARWRCSTA
jgi:hypothetical protein